MLRMEGVTNKKDLSKQYVTNNTNQKKNLTFLPVKLHEYIYYSIGISEFVLF